MKEDDFLLKRFLNHAYLLLTVVLVRDISHSTV